MLGRRRCSGDAKDRGAVAVEFVLVVPMVLLVVFGIMDFSLLLKDKTAVSNLAKDASRVASANPRLGNVEGHKGPPTAAAPTRIQSFASLAATKVESSGGALEKDTITEFWVYLANRQGYPLAPGSTNWKQDTNTTMTCSEDDYCVRYRWDDASNEFRWVSGVWDPQRINACPRSVPATLAPPSIPDGQAVGVYVQVAHKGLFGSLFNTSRRLSERSVVAFEPLPSDSCKS